MKLSKLVEHIEYELVQGSLDTEVADIAYDSRKIKEGMLFVAIAGTVVDGHKYIPDVVKKGASVLVVEKEIESIDESITVIRVANGRAALSLLSQAYFDYPASKMISIGITGTKGKSTTTYMIRDIIEKSGKTCGIVGTIGVAIAGKVTPTEHTTPESYDLQRYFKDMVGAGCEYMVMEVSSQGIKMDRVAGMHFNYGIFTNITPDHIGPNEHKDFEEYLCCKAMLLNQSRRAYVNCDDRHLDAFMKYVTLSDGSDGSTKQVFYYGEGEKADYRIGNLKKSQNGVLEAPGIEFTMSGALDADIRVNLPGDFNMYNAAAAVAIAHDMGISTDIINKGLTHLRIRGRFDIVFNNGHFAVCVDFAHNGYSTRNHLEALREYHPKRIVCVFGADGNRSKYRRYEMGEASALLADLSIVTAGHNRYETFDQIFADIKIGIDKAQKEKAEPVSYLVIPNRKEAIRYAIEHAQEGDMITILGLGHESYQEENGVKTPHSDIQFAAQCCKECYPQG